MRETGVLRMQFNYIIFQSVINYNKQHTSSINYKLKCVKKKETN